MTRGASIIFVVALATTSAACADIISTTGAAHLIARPADAQLNHLTNNTQIFVWNEARNVQLSAAVSIDASAPGQYTSSQSFLFSSIAAGTVVSSQFIHFDTVNGLFVEDGSITLDADILGVIAWNKPDFRHLDGSDAVFGLGTLFSAAVDQRGVFDVGDGSTVPQDDTFTISADHRTLSFHLQVGSPYDELRVLTAPEPSVAALFTLLVPSLRRRR